MRPRALKRRLIFVGIVGVLAAGVSTTAVAKADPGLDYAVDNALWICARIAHNPTTNGVGDLGLDIAGEGLSLRDAGEAIGIAVVNVCPEYEPLLQKFIARYGRVQEQIT